MVAHHMVPRRALEVGRLRVSRPDAMTVMVGGPQRSHDEGSGLRASWLRPARRRRTALWPMDRVPARPLARTVRVLNDPLGMAWLYVAKVPGGYLLSSDLAALGASYPGELTVDQRRRPGAAGNGLRPQRRDMSSTRSRCCHRARWWSSASGAQQTLSVCRPPYGDRHAGLSRDEKFDMIDAALCQRDH